MINICLLYTTYHSYIWDKIQEKHPATQKIVVLNFSKRRTKERPNVIVKIDRSRDSKIKVLAESLKIATISKFKKYNLTLPHPDHLLGNTLFFNKNATKITWIEDGILNYYSTQKLDKTLTKRQKKRALLTHFTPFRYKKFKGHLSGIHATLTKNTAGWFHTPDKVVDKNLFNELFTIPQNNQNTTQTNRRLALLIEQPLEKFLSKELANQIRKRTKKILENNYELVIIKKHPEHINTATTNIRNEINTPINPSLPIEEQIGLINPSDVLSFCSTALINIKKSHQNIRCIAIGLNEIRDENPNLIGLTEIFKDSGVEIQ